MAFNGSSSALIAPGTSKLDLSSSMTLAAWIKTTNSTRAESILSKYDSSGFEAGYLFMTTAGGTLGLRLGGNNLAAGGRQTLDSKKINDGLWHHVAVVITLGQSVTFYVDGVQSSSLTVVSAAGTSSVPFEVGSISYIYYAAGFTGSIDEVKVFSSALTAAQVAGLVSATPAPVPAPSPSPVVSFGASPTTIVSGSS